MTEKEGVNTMYKKLVQVREENRVLKAYLLTMIEEAKKLMKGEGSSTMMGLIQTSKEYVDEINNPVKIKAGKSIKEKV